MWQLLTVTWPALSMHNERQPYYTRYQNVETECSYMEMLWIKSWMSDNGNPVKIFAVYYICCILVYLSRRIVSKINKGKNISLSSTIKIYLPRNLDYCHNERILNFFFSFFSPHITCFVKDTGNILPAVWTKGVQGVQYDRVIIHLQIKEHSS